MRMHPAAVLLLLAGGFPYTAGAVACRYVAIAFFCRARRLERAYMRLAPDFEALRVDGQNANPFDCYDSDS